MDPPLDEEITRMEEVTRRVAALGHDFIVRCGLEGSILQKDIKEYFNRRIDELEEEILNLRNLLVEELRDRYNMMLDPLNLPPDVSHGTILREIIRVRGMQVKDDTRSESIRRLKEFNDKWQRVMDHPNRFQALCEEFPEHSNCETPTTADTSTSKATSSITCYKCGMNGHLSFSCTKKKRICYNCKKAGHISAQCFKERKPRTMGPSKKRVTVAAGGKMPLPDDN